MCSWVRSHLYDILEKNLAVFCPCSEDLSEAEDRSKGLLIFFGEINLKTELGVLVTVTIAIMEYHGQKKVGEEGVCLAYTSTL